jgi:Rieske 2Fe-2S family protein
MALHLGLKGASGLKGGLCHLSKRGSRPFHASPALAACSTAPAAPAPRIRDAQRFKHGKHIVQAIGQRDGKSGLPGEFYSEPGILECDLQAIWYKDWIFAGHDCELGKKGDYFTMQLGEFPIIVIRGKDDILRAFHNVCRHRGFKICDEVSGNSKRRLKCPYHQWTYELDGKLAFARDFESEGDNFNKEDYSLKPVAMETAGGYIFVSVADEPKPFAPMGQLLDSYLAPFDLRKAKVAHRSSIIEEGNWKMVWENNRECYHCKSNHDELVTTFPDGAWWNGLSGTPEERAMVAQLAKRCEDLGLPSEYLGAENQQYRAMRIPLTDNAHSFTMDGSPAMTSTKRLGTMPVDEPVGDVLFYSYPSTWNHFVADHAITFRLLPISPTKTELVTTWLVPGDAEEGVDYNLEDLTCVWRETNAQDKALVERNQIGVSSPAYQPGPYNTAHEDGVIRFVNWYCESLLENIETQSKSSEVSNADHEVVQQPPPKMRAAGR